MTGSNAHLERQGEFSRGRPDFWAPALLVALGILFFFDPLFSSKNYYFRDILNFHYPLRRVLIDAFARGEFPLWNPFIYLGQPMLANPNYMAFYPTNLLHLILPFNYAFKLHFILHPLFAGPGIYFLQRRLGIGPAAALPGSLAYQFSGTLLSFLNLYNIIPAVALLPWIGWSFLGALKGNRFRRTLLFGSLLGLQVIAFEPLMFQGVVLLIAALSLYCLIESDARVEMVAALLRVGFAGSVIALGLAAVQILPTLELLPRSARGTGFDFAYLGGWSMHPMDLLNSIVPNLFGNPYSMGYATSWGESFHAGREGYLVSFFLGTTTVLFCLLSFLSRRKALQRTLVLLAVTGIGLALGSYGPLYGWLVEHFSPFRLGRYPSKYLLVATLAISVMASLGVEVLLRPQEDPLRRRRHVLVVGILGLLASGAFLGCYVYMQAHPAQVADWLHTEVAPDLKTAKDFPVIASQLTRSVLSSGFFLLISSAMVLAAPFMAASAVLAGLPLVLLAAELIPPNLSLTPLISDADVDFVPEVNAYIQRHRPGNICRVLPPLTSAMRKISDLQILAPNRSAAWLTLFYRRSGQPFYGVANGIQYSVYGSVDHLETKEAADLWKMHASLPEPIALTLLQKLNSPMLLLSGDVRDARVRPIASFDTRSNVNLSLSWLDGASDRAYFAPNVELADSPDEALRRFLRPDFSYRNTVILEDMPGREASGSSATGTVRITSYESQRISCEIEANSAGYLVLLDSYYPGWRAFVDGLPSGIIRANYAFRAVAVPMGKHQVEFRYRPDSFYWGFGISSMSLICCFVLLPAIAYKKERDRISRFFS